MPVPLSSSNQPVSRLGILAAVLLLGVASQARVARASGPAPLAPCGDGSCAGDETDVDCPQDCGCSAAADTCSADIVAPYGCFCDADCSAEGDCCADVDICSPPTDGQGAEVLCEGGFGSRKSSFFKKIELRGMKTDLQLLAGFWGDIGWDEAGEYLTHYLDGSGADKEVDVDKLIEDVESFKKKVQDSRIKLGMDRVALSKTEAATAVAEFPIPADWCHNLTETDQCGHAIGFTEDPNWYLALRSWGFRHLGTMTIEPPGDQWTYTVDSRVVVQKVYNFEPEKNLPGLDFENIAELHCYGWAREYLLRGESSDGAYTGTVAP